MSFVLLHADAGTTLLADDPILPASQVAPLHDALALLAAGGEVRAQADTAREAAADAGRADGLREGRAAAHDAAQAELGAEMLRLGEELSARAAAQRHDLIRLATGVVRRIAGDLGPELVAGLVERAAAEMAAEQEATVRVHPAAADATARRLAARPRLRVEADAALAPAECVIDTPFGRTLAGLEPQLARIEQAWKQAGEQTGHAAG